MVNKDYLMKLIEDFIEKMLKAVNKNNNTLLIDFEQLISTSFNIDSSFIKNKDVKSIVLKFQKSILFPNAKDYLILMFLDLIYSEETKIDDKVKFFEIAMEFDKSAEVPETIDFLCLNRIHSKIENTLNNNVLFSLFYKKIIKYYLRKKKIEEFEDLLFKTSKLNIISKPILLNAGNYFYKELEKLGELKLNKLNFSKIEIIQGKEDFEKLISNV